ncbi:MAG: type II secretion system protein [Oscillospiraceae bacterium]|nr:type II secretion system protein [Oscillospiraceae bacterium]
MKKNSRKGFTIVELVIVIAVIAILAAVLIPTFSGIIKKAQDSKVVQEANAAYKMYVAAVDYVEGETALQDFVIKVDDKYVAVKDAQMDDTIYDSADNAATAAGCADVENTDASVEGYAEYDYYIVEKTGETAPATGATFA